MMDYSTIVQIGDIYVSGDILTEYFSCDYDACKGKCCIAGDSGAPLKEEELEPIEAAYDKFSPLMSGKGREAVAAKGFFEVDREGDIVTPVVPGTEECAYTLFEGGSCFCAIERCFLSGGCRFKKPVSCRLYPIRVVQLGEGTIGLNLHRWDICSDAFEKGRREGIRVYEFLKEPLTETFGAEFYDALTAAAARLNLL